jgi:hypothetical protein
MGCAGADTQLHWPRATAAGRL